MHSVSHFAGFGLGLRKPHYADFLDHRVPVDFVEVISENFMVDGGMPLRILREVRERYPVALHGVSMSIGSADGLDPAYLRRLRVLVDTVDPLFVSDHLCWTGIGGRTSHDLLPLPYSKEALAVVCTNIDAAQQALGRQMLVENPSSYVAFAESTLTESAFLAQICARTGCGLLLDVNNVFVSARNQGVSPQAWIDAMPLDHVRQIHLAGHSEGEHMLVDTHDSAVRDAVWELYARVMPRLGAVATMIERDDSIPPLHELLCELDTARAIARDAVAIAA